KQARNLPDWSANRKKPDIFPLLPQGSAHPVPSHPLEYGLLVDQEFIVYRFSRKCLNRSQSHDVEHFIGALRHHGRM
ncbi:hypothetical protein, partial [Pseudomonas syringae]|uniref:hypothetical protein n=1 Tax=Pseudomonas syringae TaxID=317 RepID=UPI0019D33BAC